MQYRILGPLEVTRDGEPIDLGGPKQRAVLGVLLLNAGRVVSTDRLVEAVWGEQPPGNVAASLQAYLSNLRRLLRDDATAASPIVRQAPGYRIEIAGEQIDLTQFGDAAEQAHRAVADADWPVALAAANAALDVRRGPLLADLQDEAWVQIEATALDERFDECAELLITALLGAGRTTEAVAQSRAHYVHDPLRERACWLYVLALHRAERTAEALEIYRAHVRSLDDELGLEPGAALRDLHGAVLRQDPDLLTWPQAPTGGAPGVVVPTLSTTATNPIVVPPDAAHLVGRIDELAIADQLLQQSRAGASRWLVLTGPAGIGKSRLAHEVMLHAAAEGARILRAGCPDDDGLPPWWPIRQLVQRLDADPGVVLVLPADADADAARFAVYGRVQSLLIEAASETPLVVFVDDVQWADLSSLRFLTYLASVPEESRIVVVLTVRDGVPSDGLHRLLDAVARRPGTRQLALPPLVANEVAELVSRVSGDEVERAEAERLTRRTGGNPFFVREFARLPQGERGTGEMPIAVRSVLGRRLAELDPAVLQVLRIAAVIGDVLDVGLLRRVSRLDPDELADLLDEAADEDIIEVLPDSRSYAFAHALLRDEVLAGISEVRRQRLHHQVAAAIEPSGDTAELVRRAAHLVAAIPLVDTADAYAACCAAARDADERLMSDTAADWWETAVEVFDQLSSAERTESERDNLVIARVAALSRAGRGQTVLDVVGSAVVEAAQAGRAAFAGRLSSMMLRTGGAWPWASHGEDATPLLSRLAAVEQLVRHDPPAHAQVLAAMAVGSC